MPLHNSGNWKVSYGPGDREPGPPDPPERDNVDDELAEGNERAWETEPAARVSEDPFDLDEDDPIYDDDERVENMIALHEDIEERSIDCDLDELDSLGDLDDDDFDERELGDAGA